MTPSSSSPAPNMKVSSMWNRKMLQIRKRTTRVDCESSLSRPVSMPIITAAKEEVSNKVCRGRRTVTGMWRWYVMQHTYNKRIILSNTAWKMCLTSVCLGQNDPFYTTWNSTCSACSNIKEHGVNVCCQKAQLNYVADVESGWPWWSWRAEHCTWNQTGSTNTTRDIHFFWH